LRRSQRAVAIATTTLTVHASVGGPD
jgi:hypothetical protein